MILAEWLTIMNASTPLLLAALGVLVVERAGVLNLGVEGMMLMGAVVGFILALSGTAPWLCFIGAALAGVSLALVFAIFALGFKANQVATGLAVAILGTGLSSLIGAKYVGQQFDGFGNLAIPYLSDIPVLGVVLFNQNLLIYLSFLMLALVVWFFYKTKLGLILRGIGDNHYAAHALGHRVILIRCLAIAFGGAMAGLGGAYMSLISPHLWTQELTAGRGWIAIALVVFATWRPVRLLFGAYLFGSISVLQYNLQNNQWFFVAPQLWAMLPYVVTILVLVIISNPKISGRFHAPADLGKVFHPTR
nr:ABC transporter permease [Ostreibacterium oceani]